MSASQRHKERKRKSNIGRIFKGVGRDVCTDIPNEATVAAEGIQGHGLQQVDGLVWSPLKGSLCSTVRQKALGYMDQ